MTVYLLVNNCPHEFGDMSILAVYSNGKAARREFNRLRGIDPYEYQYLEILRRKVRD